MTTQTTWDSSPLANKGTNPQKIHCQEAKRPSRSQEDITHIRQASTLASRLTLSTQNESIIKMKGLNNHTRRYHKTKRTTNIRTISQGRNKTMVNSNECPMGWQLVQPAVKRPLRDCTRLCISAPVTATKGMQDLARRRN